MAQQPPTVREQWELVGVVLGVLAAVAAVVRWPLWWSFKHLVREAMKPEIEQIAKLADTVDANGSRFEFVQATLEAQGLALREVPRMAGAMESMTSTLEGLRATIGDLNKLVVGQGQQLGHVTGMMESEWRGDERRRRGRRADDPPEHDEGGDK